MDTKTELLNHAEHAIRTRGFDGFSYADLAEAVGIRKASVHYHFATKAILSAALMDRYTRRTERVCQSISEENETAAAQLQEFINFYRSALNDGQTVCLCISLTISRESLSDAVKQSVNDFRTMIIHWLCQVYALAQHDGTISGVTDPNLDARSTLALLEGAHLAARTTEDATVFDQVTLSLQERFTRR